MLCIEHVRSLSADELLTVANAIQKETARRIAFVAGLPEVSVSGLRLTIKTRSLLTRVVTNWPNATVPKNGTLTIRNLFILLRKENWLHMEYSNSRAFGEMKGILIQHDALLEEYYGLFSEKGEASLSRRLMQPVDDGQL